MFVFSEASDNLPSSASLQDLKTITHAAWLVGCRVYSIPDDFAISGTARDALAYVPVQDKEAPGVWIGFIPPPERYAQMYEAALEKRIRLLNTPEEHLTAQEFDRAYARLGDLTPRSRIITDVEQCEAAAQELGLPVFVKGAVQSVKAEGWKACVAQTVEELERLAAGLLRKSFRTRGKVVVRELVSLRYDRISGNGFPFGREYRVFLYRNAVLEMGYYWEGKDALAALTLEERREVVLLAMEASKRLNVPYVVIDIGQKTDGSWIVIETGDAQFSGISQVPLLSLWNKIGRIGEETHT